MLRFLVLIIAAFHIAKCSEVSVDSTIPKENTNPRKSDSKVQVSSKNETKPNICGVCSCEGSKMDCTGKTISMKFTEYSWPSKPLDEVLFKHNSLKQIWRFPAVEIRKLIISDNLISSISDAAFKELKNLSVLDLSSNGLTDKHLNPEEFEGKFSMVSYEPLEFLRVLNLSNNDITTLNQDFFEHMKKLTKLDLSYNHLNTLEGSTAIAINEISQLEELNLAYCKLNNIESIWSTVKTLKKLNLSGNSFTKLPKVLDHAEKLQVLILDANPIESVSIPSSFPNSLRELKELSMSMMPRLRTLDKGSMSNLGKLETLIMKSCHKLFDISEDTFASASSTGTYWPPIKKLDLSDNALQYLPHLLLARWDQLEELDLANNPWSCDCRNIELVQMALPQLRSKITLNHFNEVKCAGPPALKDMTLVSLEKHNLRCLDYYGAQPQNDAIFLIGIFAGILIAIPISLTAFFIWRNGLFCCGPKGPASYSRAFYKRTTADEDGYA